jgi:hypothetical protein
MLTKWLIGWPEQQLGCLLYPLFGFLLSNPPPLLYNLCLAILAMKLMDDFLPWFWNPTRWSTRSGDRVTGQMGWPGLTRVNPKKKLCFFFSSFWYVPQTTRFVLLNSYPLLSSMLDFCLASGRWPENAGDVADMAQAERPCPETTGGVEDRYPNRISRKWK